MNQYNNQSPYSYRNTNFTGDKTLRQILEDMEKEEIRMRNGYPIHCPPLRTSSGVRFGW